MQQSDSGEPVCARVKAKVGPFEYNLAGN